MKMYEMFCERIASDLVEFEQELKKSSVETVIDRAYELTMKREIAGIMIGNEALFESWSVADQAKAVNMSGILDWFYQFWLKSDYNIVHDIEDFICFTINTRALPEPNTSVFQ